MDYTQILKKQNICGPQAFVDLNHFDENAKQLAAHVQGLGMTVRIATKSIRVPELIRRALNSSPHFKGLMCYSAEEALFLSSHDFDNFLVAYPTVSPKDLQALHQLHESGKEIYLVVDHTDHLKALDLVFKKSAKPFKVILEMDLSLRLGPLVVGVRRSPLRSEKQILDLLQEIQKMKSIEFAGLMAYEAQVAGVGDQNPFKPFLSLLLGPIRKFSAWQIARNRKSICEKIKSVGVKNFIFNGGGTGSLSFNESENKVLTELTAGSGFYCPHLFDYYSNFKLKPSAFFALQVVRQPEPDWVTCLGGGYVASGEPGWDRIPKPYDPEAFAKGVKTISSFRLSDFEATGEVQTPVQVAKELKIGDLVIFRHAKAGELMERFNDVLLIAGNSPAEMKIVGEAKTYRGFGQCYF